MIPISRCCAPRCRPRSEGAEALLATFAEVRTAALEGEAGPAGQHHTDQVGPGTGGKGRARSRSTAPGQCGGLARQEVARPIPDRARSGGRPDRQGLEESESTCLAALLLDGLNEVTAGEWALDSDADRFSSGVQLYFIRLGRSVENAFIESFN